jgi:oxygen-independent coproporphyrinogen-3 oxidase
MFSLYCHIPYCTSICPYCDFNVYAPKARPEERYVDSLLAEMRHWALEEPWRGGAVQTVYLGGGTPSLFAPESIRRLLDGVHEVWDVEPEAEITLEATPESVTAERLALYRAAGVNRLSLGLQSMHAHHLARLGRLHTGEENRCAVAAARAVGFDNVSTDLIFAVPGETLSEWEADLFDVVSLAPEHVSAYNLTYEEHTPFFGGRARGDLVPLAEEDEEAMFLRAREILSAAGYEPYEISSFAQPGFRSRHNRSYWNGSHYLGLGAGAHSYDAGGWGRRWSNERNPLLYMAAVESRGQARTQPEELTMRQAMSEFLFLGLRQAEGVDASAFAQRFGAPLAQGFPHLRDLCSEGVLESTAVGYRLSPRGLLLADSVFVRLL